MKTRAEALSQRWTHCPVSKLNCRIIYPSLRYWQGEADDFGLTPEWRRPPVIAHYHLPPPTSLNSRFSHLLQTLHLLKTMQSILSHSFICHRFQFTPRGFTLGIRTLSYTAQRRVQPVGMGFKTDITLYTGLTPNGIKVPILLEELGLDYKVREDTMPY